MKYVINREKEDLLRFMKTKAEKTGLVCKAEREKLAIESIPGDKNDNQEVHIPVTFRGKIEAEGDVTVIKGRFDYGFYYSTMLFLGATLIIARLILSLINRNTTNIILCGAAAVLLIGVVVVVNKSARPQKEKIQSLLENSEKVNG